MPTEMTDPYGPLLKTQWVFAIFAVPALLVAGIGLGLVWEETGSLAEAVTSEVVLITSFLGVAGLIWGAVFTLRPIVVLLPDGLEWPGVRRIEWSDIASVEVGKSTTTVVSSNTGQRKVVHEVLHLQHTDGNTTEVVTSWAVEGPVLAFDRVAKAFELSRQAALPE